MHYSGHMYWRFHLSSSDFNERVKTNEEIKKNFRTSNKRRKKRGLVASYCKSTVTRVPLYEALKFSLYCNTAGAITQSTGTLKCLFPTGTKYDHPTETLYINDNKLAVLRS